MCRVFYFIYAQFMLYFFNFCYLCCVFAVVAGPVAGSGPPAVSLRCLLCLAVALVVCRASVAGSFGSCRGLWPTLGLKRLVLGIFLLWAGGQYGRFSRPFLRLICTRLWASSCRFGGSSPGLGL